VKSDAEVASSRPHLPSQLYLSSDAARLVVVLAGNSFTAVSAALGMETNTQVQQRNRGPIIERRTKVNGVEILGFISGTVFRMFYLTP
jgi:hypothetical protein